MKAEKFWAKVDKSGACWLWTGARMPSGYGRCSVERKDWLAHRWAMVLTGHDVAGMLVCHRCDNPTCVRPDHLFLGTVRDNAQDMLEKGRSRSILSKEQIERIQLGLERGTDGQVAERLGTTDGVVWGIRTGRSFTEQKKRLIDAEFEGL